MKNSNRVISIVTSWRFRARGTPLLGLLIVALKALWVSGADEGLAPAPDSGATLTLRFGDFEESVETELALPDSAGEVLVVESSSNLKAWVARGEFERDGSEDGLTFLDHSVAGVGQRYYRLRTSDSMSAAHVRAATVSGASGAHRFSVTLASPDTGCDQYADWWEVVSLDGDLRERRVLAHSHANEQPFTRSGGSAPIATSETVLIRAHMNTSGYGGVSLIGSPESGFRPILLNREFANELASESPLPSGCAF